MIPKIIHQIWIGPRPRPEGCMNSWHQHNPGWEYKLWTDANLPKLRNQAVYDAFGTQYHGKADVLRYEILHEYGGFYADADSRCLRPIDDFLADEVHDSFGCWEQEIVRRGLIGNAFLGASQGNALMKILIEEIEARYAARGDDFVLVAPWISTGPLLVTEAIEGFNYNRFKIYPSWVFMPKHLTGTIHAGPEQPYADHYWGTTFNRYDELIYEGLLTKPGA